MENLMQKQKAAIKQLEKEQTEIATEMKLAASSKNQKPGLELWPNWISKKECFFLHFYF